MASFLTGPAAQLVGAGMQAIGVGIPVGQTSAKVIDGLRDCGLPVPPRSWFKRKDSGAQEPRPRDERPSRTVYDRLEAHINGVAQVVRPAIELKRLVREGCCKSAERPRRPELAPRDPSPRCPAPSRSPAESTHCTPRKCSWSGCRLFGDQPSPPPERRAAGRPRERGGRRCGSGSSDEEARCVSCSRSRSLLQLPCGRLICRKCEETGAHESECKRCRAAEKSRLYC